MISISTSVFEMIIWQLIIGSSHSFLWPAGESLLSTDVRRRKKYIAHMIMIFVGGIMVGPLLGALVLEVSNDDDKCHTDLLDTTYSSHQKTYPP